MTIRPELTRTLSDPRRRMVVSVTGLRRLPWLSRLAAAFVGLLVLVAVFATLLTPHDPTATGLAPVSTGPGSDFWFGVDRSGRDIFSRLVAGTRRSLVVGFGAAGLALLLGTVLGAVAATSRRAVDEAVMRTLDVVMAFPAIALSAVLIVAFGKDSLLVLVVAIGFVFTPSIARVVRANVQSQYREDYVAAEHVIGAGRLHILVRHVVRNCAAPVLVFATVMVADSIVFEASLSFIGGGLPGHVAESSWGSVIAYGKDVLLAGSWWATFFPGLLILLTVLSLNILSEGISDAWAAPAARRSTARSRGAVADEADAGTTTDADTDDADVDTDVTAGDRVEAPTPGSGEVPALPGLDQARRRLAARARPLPQGEPTLAVRDLRIGFDGRHDGVDIVDGISFDVRPGEVLGLVGESGSGKSLTALTVMGLSPKGARVNGEVLFDRADLLTLSAARRRALMGRDIAMVYQDALSALNPAMRVRAQLEQLTKRGGTRTPTELMQLVGLDPERTLGAYPHELSGGQRQRVVIAMALSRDPRLLIADEPTTALDVTVQAQVMALLLSLQQQLGFALVLVSHDLALVSDVCDRVVVMYGGQIVEAGVTADVVGSPAHHYARGLLGSVLSLETGAERLTQIRGVVPSPADFPPGCRFADRCPMASAVCRSDTPRLEGVDGRHVVACHHPVDPPGAASAVVTPRQREEVSS
ncbi:dipeptide/oligopeptide/nickel ABC transporter permease/ATP-binding protein [Terracoccus luteus]|uniref:Peptide/nickel transport system permease protein n=1 Tax=Terracoccus luteus TaxID=53356 RepID=A0A839Q570_9MICO|nr:dipeptide/oligopeptide/nickel ABC transporter permease/ATP-binding protein [Terracoccus luteus]MBB2988332.1 peptide/nickel transport system permease protein [Terracoccus luteus]MCP2173967.1 peptide/nickel transport system permease protein [Terracoccus luteus]